MMVSLQYAKPKRLLDIVHENPLQALKETFESHATSNLRENLIRWLKMSTRCDYEEVPSRLALHHFHDQLQLFIQAVHLNSCVLAITADENKQ